MALLDHVREFMGEQLLPSRTVHRRVREEDLSIAREGFGIHGIGLCRRIRSFMHRDMTGRLTDALPQHLAHGEGHLHRARTGHGRCRLRSELRETGWAR